ncbi:response regulator transcription factor [Acidimangrovimonas sediminis]|uniref:response regulator transcription factor n=1 Tax=Acidimangrovimonas sediminis TaxID=2056283 RepID=UPI001304EE00|nr:helix-turn-helix transcriptional regulator [Acidimangrovimonas sediminis]
MSEPIYRRIDESLAAMGGEGFARAFLDLAERSGARQVMIFDVTPDRALCLMSRNYSAGRMGEALARRYLDGWFREDPLLPELMALPEGALALRRVDGAALEASPDYRALFFARPGLGGKLALLAAGRRRRLIVNFYHGAGEAGAIDEGLAQLAGRLALMHFDGQGAGEAPVPPALAALSGRERETCLGILSGKKAETIAGEIGVRASTVATYRKRAYDKLGIASRAALFAICRQG